MGFLHNALKSIQKADQVDVSQPPGKIVAVDIGQSHLLLLGVGREAEKIKVTNFHLEPRPSSPEAVSERMKAIFVEEKLEPRSVRTALKTPGMVVRILTFPQMRRSELTSMLQYEVEKYIPFKASEVLLDFDVLEENIDQGGKKCMDIILVAVRRNEVYEIHRMFENAGIQVESISIGAAVLANAIDFAFPQSKKTTVAFLEMGTESTTFGILLNGKPVFVRDISFGGSDIMKMLKRKLGPRAEKTAGGVSAEYKTTAEQAVGNLLSELKLSLGYYMERIVGARSIETLYVAGGGFRFIADPGYIEEQIKIPVKRAEIFSRIELDSRLDPALIKQNEDLLLSALGLCL